MEGRVTMPATRFYRLATRSINLGAEVWRYNEVPMTLILASSSPRRRELLRAAGLDFEVRPSRASEERQPGETAERLAERVARQKAFDVAATAPPASVVLGADTAVVIEEEIFGKPADAADAVRMLRRLSGAAHRVITGICLVRAPDRLIAQYHETTWVYFRKLDENEIQDYVASGEPLDKAGGYGIQGLASKFVTRVEGCYFNVVGLPISRLAELLRQTGPG